MFETSSQPSKKKSKINQQYEIVSDSSCLRFLVYAKFLKQALVHASWVRTTPPWAYATLGHTAKRCQLLVVQISTCDNLLGEPHSSGQDYHPIGPSQIWVAHFPFFLWSKLLFLARLCQSQTIYLLMSCHHLSFGAYDGWRQVGQIRPLAEQNIAMRIKGCFPKNELAQ